jgi:tRNA pseudouridine55 synthase
MKMDGLLIVDKPAGMISLDVVREIKTGFFIRKAGHIGTLDPFATGVLPIVINEGTKLVPFLQEDPKDYEAVMKIGEETTTDDLTGEIVRRKAWESVSPETIGTAMEAFTGKIRQIPPMFSAVKVKGTPLYKMARKGIEIERGEKEVQIFDIRVRKTELPWVHFGVSCSRGTYIRTLTRDIGVKIGCGAHLVSLRRTRSGPFYIEQAIPMEKLRALSGGEALRPYLIPLREALFSLPEVIGDARLVEKVRQGKEMVAGDLKAQLLPAIKKGEWLKMSSSEEGLVAILKAETEGAKIGTADPGRMVLRPIRVFQNGKGR